MLLDRQTDRRELILLKECGTYPGPCVAAKGREGLRRTSHNGNSRKFVQSFTGVLCTAENGCQNPEQRWSHPPEGAFQTGVVRAGDKPEE